MILPKYWIMI